MPWSIAQALDTTLMTLEDLDKGHWTDMAFALQDFPGYDMFDENKIVVTDGDQIRINYRYNNNLGNFRWVGLGAIDQIAIEDTYVSGYVPWTKFTTGWGIDKFELSMNRGKSRIVEVLKGKKAMMYGEMAERLEANFFSKGPADSTDTTTGFGLYYWLVYNATEGFNGGAQTGFSAGPAGVSPTTYPNHRNWTFNYAAISKADAILKMRKAYRKTKFKSPLPKDLQGGRSTESRKSSQYVIFVGYDTLASFENIGESQNENLGRDIAPMDGEITFRSVPIRWAPQLDDATGAPIIGINKEQTKVVCMEGWDMALSEPEKAPNQHTVLRQHLDYAGNIIMYDRRSAFLGATADPA